MTVRGVATANRSRVRAWIAGIVGAVAVAALAAGLLSKLHAHTTSGHWETPLPPVVLGMIVGLTYGLLAVGLVLVYRTNRVVNFAHGEIGAFGAAFFGLAVVRWHVPYWVAFPFGLALGGLVGGIAEVAVVRRLRKAPRLMSVVATLAVGAAVVGFARAVNSTAGAGFLYPEPSGLPTFRIGGLLVTRAYTGMLILGPALVVALIVFLRKSRYGLALRAASASPETARMAGVFASRMSSLAWVLAGALSAFTAIITQPSLGFTGAQSFGPPLLLRALAAAAIGRMTSLPTALVAGVGLGIVEQLLLWNYSQAGLVDVALFAVIIIALLVQRARVGREDDERGSWASVQVLRPVPDALRDVWLVRHLGTIVGAVALAFAAALPLFVSNSSAVTLSGIYALAIVGLSLGIVTGLGGQLSIGQFAIAAVAAVVSFRITAHGGSFVLAFVYAAIAAGFVSLLLGLPALRSRGLMLTVTTLAFALITPTWLLGQSWMLGSGVDPRHPVVLGTRLDSGRRYYALALVLLVVVLFLVRNVRRGGLGRVLTAVRDNEDNARAFTVAAARVKSQAFVLAGVIAGLGGALYAHSLVRINPASFPTRLSIDLVVMAVIGGLGIATGPLLGALLVLAPPAFVPLDSAGVTATSFGQLLIIMYLPGGIAQIVEPLRNRLVALLGRRAGVDVAAAYAGATPTGGERIERSGIRIRDLAGEPARALPPGEALLEATDLVKSYGGVHAVDHVSLVVRAGETVGLIGPNGAGKTTTFELLSGFVRPDAGAVWFDGQDVTPLGPESRARLGLVRSFQDSALFPTLTVTEAVAVAAEGAHPTRFLSSLTRLSAAERTKRAYARDLVGIMGLHPYRDMQIQELSTGTRRIAEIACLVAARPALLLFDEPSTGIAQRETEALGDVIRQLKDALGVTLVVIEHDMPLIMGISDRIIAMADGHVIASGDPRTVQNDPTVIEAYLGGTLAAIERSGPARTGNGSPGGAPKKRRPRAPQTS
ncbi:MAG: ATP-binding cassette domain-containing protein [Actinobacteria bacterium]|nr:MAG: ATP-binding cassette domain-containing protein [Actinomycetota bacterium]